MKNYQSWGRYPLARDQEIKPVYWPSDLPALDSLPKSVLGYGYGRSYGDSCLNDGGILLDTSYLNHFLAFDEDTGLLRCGAGVSLAQILEEFVPRGWFLPVTPGTKEVSVAGAIANDIHGKNHHREGTFGCHVESLELLRSNGARLVCSASQQSDMFKATIGGLGLTGLIIWAEFKLKPITTPHLLKESIKMSSLTEFFALSKDSDQQFEYTVAWIDCLASQSHLGRGHFYRANHATPADVKTDPPLKTKHWRVPCDLPAGLLNPLTIKAFNQVYYNSQLRKKVSRLVHFEPFFYPLDGLEDWNRLYGKKGLLQYQCLIPPPDEQVVTQELLSSISQAGEGSFLAVIKKFGTRLSPGILSFPRPGTTLALDFSFKCDKTLRLLETLDQQVKDAGGVVYPAKDARMSAASFRSFFPQWTELQKYRDPQFSSGFWRRITETDKE